MDRRTDRVVGLATIVVAAIVPTAMLAVIHVGGQFTAGPAYAAQSDPAVEKFPGAAEQEKPGAAPGSGTHPYGPGAGGGGGGNNGGGSDGGGSGKPPKGKPFPAVPALVNSYTRDTLYLASDAEMENQELRQEIAHVILKPQAKFSVRAKTTYSKVVGGKPTVVATSEDNIVNGVHYVRARGETSFTKKKLSSQELATAYTRADPRYVTRTVANLPGVQRIHVALGNQTHYLLNYTLYAASPLLLLLPKQIRDQIPFAAYGLGLRIDLFADKLDHPSFLSAGLLAPPGGTGFRVLYTDVK